MSSRFVYEGDIKPAENGKVERTLDTDKQDKVASEGVTEQDEPDFQERKTLYEQLQISRHNRYQQKKKELEDQNSAYKLKHDDLAYYNELEEKRKQTIIKEKKQEEADLRKFREAQKQNVAKGISKPSIKKRKTGVIEPILRSALNEINRPNKGDSQGTGLDLGYESSDSQD